jgi:hypothetical protein
MRKIVPLLVLSLLAFALLAACASKGAGDEISKERAIELAREHVDFEPGKIEAVQDTEEGRPVWRVTFYGKGVDADHPGQVSFVVLDRRTGEVVSLGMS